MPFILGSDYSGVIDTIGSKVTNFRVGDLVCSMTPLGCFTEFIVVDETELFRVPDGCDLVDVGALPIAYGTSHVALIKRAQLRSNHVLMVLGAAGGVGLSAVQIGKASGAIVIYVARGDEKVQFLTKAMFAGITEASPLDNPWVLLWKLPEKSTGWI